MSERSELSMPKIVAISGGVALILLILFLIFGFKFLSAFIMALLLGLAVAAFLLLAVFRAPDKAETKPIAAPKPDPTPEPEPAPTPAAEPATATGTDLDRDAGPDGANEGVRPMALDAPRSGAADDLKKIKGVGPKLETLLNSLGFYHFDQISAWTTEEVTWVDANLKGFKGRVSRDNWVEQAGLLASGGETEFSKKVDKGDVY